MLMPIAGQNADKIRIVRVRIRAMYAADAGVADVGLDAAVQAVVFVAD